MQGDERCFPSVERPPPQVVGGEWSLTVGWVPRAPDTVTSLSISEKGNEFWALQIFLGQVGLKERKSEESTRVRIKVYSHRSGQKTCQHAFAVMIQVVEHTTSMTDSLE